MEIGKIYSPETISDTPFPQENIVNSNSSQASTGSADGKIYSPTKVEDQSFPIKKIATELISTQLNTNARKVTGEFQFTQMGAFQIGDYKDQEAGDIRISRNGIVARNKTGSNTVVIDSDGNAYFAGELQSGSIITGLLLLGNGDIQIDGVNRRMAFFENGLPAIVIGNS